MFIEEEEVEGEGTANQHPGAWMRQYQVHEDTSDIVVHTQKYTTIG
jgi:hypothetical protein